MIGGYQIIDLTNISVALDGGAVAITDSKIKKQLLALREYIEENYNFSKPLNNKLKPVMIRLRDAESGEEFEGCLWGNVSVIDNNLSFSIDAIVNVNPSKVLQINVVFEEQEDEVGNAFYGIKTVTYEYKGGQDSVIVTDIKNIPSATIKKLQCGDIVLKKDSSGYHAYIVSFRNATGICLTYTDASGVETQSYDKVGQNWVYNSEDKGTLPEFAPSGTIADALGLDSEGKLVKGSVGGGTKLYKHYLTLKFPNKTIGDTTVNTLVTTLITNSSNVISASNLASELSKIVCIQGISQFKSGSYPMYDIDLLKIEDSGGIQIKYFPLQAIGTLASMTYQTGISLGNISGFTEITDSVTAL